MRSSDSQRVGDVLFAGDESLGRTPSAVAAPERDAALPALSREPALAGRLACCSRRSTCRTTTTTSASARDATASSRNGSSRTARGSIGRSASRTERRLAGVVLFVDAAPRFGAPLRAPDLRGARARRLLRVEARAARRRRRRSRGRCCWCRARAAQPARRAGTPLDRPLRDAAGRTIENFARVAASRDDGEPRWLRIDVDPSDAELFRVATERRSTTRAASSTGLPRSADRSKDAPGIRSLRPSYRCCDWSLPIAGPASRTQRWSAALCAATFAGARSRRPAPASGNGRRDDARGLSTEPWVVRRERRATGRWRGTRPARRRRPRRPRGCCRD